ncbi:MAG: hypothetical protein JWO26_117 [Rhodospirillales bacterium]|nr:hypothetical protein [Rhodospirillales bacterium]MDB5380485.1 hypothetical protein [Rhodospirillales bacterium]
MTEFGTDSIPGTHAQPPEMWTEEYQVEYLRRYLDTAAARPSWRGCRCGTSPTSRRAGHEPGGGMNFKGAFTRDRRPKMAAHFLRSRWRTQ